MATTLYGALLGLWLVVLSFRVIALRGGPGLGWLKFGYTGEQALTRSIRAQGNLIEYAPMFMILMFIAESGGVSSFSLHYYGGTFLLGRLMHGICMGFMEKSVGPAFRRHNSNPAATIGHFRFAADAAVIG